VQKKIIDSKYIPGDNCFFSVLSTITNSWGTVNFHANIELYLTVVSLKSHYESRESPNCSSTISFRTQLLYLGYAITLMSLGSPCDDSVQASFSTVKCPYFGHLFDFETFLPCQIIFCGSCLPYTKHVWRSALGT
jgi:hypothetical protein